MTFLNVPISGSSSLGLFFAEVEASASSTSGASRICCDLLPGDNLWSLVLLGPDTPSPTSSRGRGLRATGTFIFSVTCLIFYIQISWQNTVEVAILTVASAAVNPGSWILCINPPRFGTGGMGLGPILGFFVLPFSSSSAFLFDA